MKGFFNDTTAYNKKPKPILDKDIEVTPIKVYSESELKNQRPWKWDKVSKITSSSEWKSLKNKEIEKAKKAKEDIIKSQKDYINSELYSTRAKPFKEPKYAVQSSLKALQKVQFEYDKLSSETNVPLNKISLESGASPSTIAHELGHITGARPGRAGVAQKLTAAEQNEIQKRNIGLRKESTKLGVPYNEVEINRYNEHSISPYENKADIESLRYMMLKNGITKSYGENIDATKMKQALENKNIKTDKHTQRLLKNFSVKDIIELNNILAANMQQNQNIA